MPPRAGLVDRVVAVTAELAPGENGRRRFRYGSGYVVAGRTVLTAAHVVAAAVKVSVRLPDRSEYHTVPEEQLVGDPGGWRADGSTGPDLALLSIGEPVDHDGAPFDEVAPVGLARVDRAAGVAVVERVRAIGHPLFAEIPSAAGTAEALVVRETVEAAGIIPVGSGLVRGLLDLQVSVAPRDLPEQGATLQDSPWAGMSGAPVLASGRLVGVVCEHAPRAGASSITVTPLTALEADPEDPGWGPGVDDAAAWWARLGVTGAAAADLTALPAPVAAPYRATLREFGAALHTRMPRLTGRQAELTAWVEFSTGQASYGWWTGGAYAGKSALAYEAVTAGVLPDTVDVVAYFLNRRRSDASGANFLAAVVPQLEILCGWDPGTPDRYRFDQAWQAAAHTAQADGRHLLLVIDALDEDLHPPGTPTVLELLPAVTTDFAHVLVTSRPYPELQHRLEPTHPLALVDLIDLTPFDGSAELAHAARQEIDDLTDGGAGADVEILGLLTAARGPLTAADLAAMHAHPVQPTATHRRLVAGLLGRAARSLEPVGPPDQPRYQYAHLTLADHAQDNLLLADPDYRDRINDWAHTWSQAGWPAPRGGGTASRARTPAYLLDSYPGALQTAGDITGLAVLAGDPAWVAAAIQTQGADFAWATLHTAAQNGDATVQDLLAIVAAQANALGPLRPLTQPGYVLRQMCLQALIYQMTDLVDTLRAHLDADPDNLLTPMWTSHHDRPPALELGTHDNFVAAVAELVDGRVITGGRDGRVRVWDLARPGVPVELGTHDAWVVAVAELRDGRVVTGGWDRRVRVWDLARPGVPVELGTHDDSVEAVAELADGRVVAGGQDGRVLVWDLARPGDPVVLGTHDAWVVAVAELADGRVVTGGQDGRVRVWDLARPGIPVELGTHDHGVGAVAELADGRVVTGGQDGRVLVWDLARPGDPVELGTHDASVEAVAELADGRVVTGGRDRRVLVWDLAQPGIPVELGTHDDPVEAVAELADGRVVTGGDDRRVRVWDLARPGIPVQRGTKVGGVEAVAELADGRVVTGGRDGRVLVWDLARPGDPVELGIHDGGVEAVAELADGRVVTGGVDGRVLVWDLARPGIPVELGTHDAWVQAVAELADGRVVTGGYDGRLLVSDLAHPSDPVELGTHDDWVSAVAELSNGRVVAGDSDGWVLVWDLACPGIPVVLGTHDAGVWAVAALSDGRVVTGGVDRRVLVWDLNRPGDPIELGAHDNGVEAVAELADGRVVTGGRDGRVRVWDLAQPGHIQAEAAIKATALATSTTASRLLLIGSGVSVWEVRSP